MFFRHHIRAIPGINPNYWSFSIGGAVRVPLILSYNDLRALPARTIRAVIACAGMRDNFPLIGEAAWGGVPLGDLLARIDVEPAARYARILAADGYSAVLPLESLAETLLAYTMDGAPLPPEHGFPARLIAPGRAGYKMPKWITRIEVTDTAKGGFWESRGWSLDGEARITTALVSHQRAADGAVDFTGIAYTGKQTLESLAISIDGGAWMPIAFTPAAPHTLVHWRVAWLPPGSGDYHVRVHATDSATHAEHSQRIEVR